MMRLLRYLSFGAFLVAFESHASATLVKRKVVGAVSVEASQVWDGNDGKWSSFGINVGTPPQQLRLIPSTAQNSIWVVLSEACKQPGLINITNCDDTRGTEYQVNITSEDHRLGDYFGLNFEAGGALGYAGNTEIWQENVTLGWNGSGAPFLVDQVIQGYVVDFPWVGVFGLNPRAINLTGVGMFPTVIASLRTENIIPSTSWGYTAGAIYIEPTTFGSLTLGGYDQKRFTPNSLTIPFGADITWDLLLAVRSITSNSTTDPLLSQGIFALIDSLVATMWLPLAVCEAFEEAFNLTWNETLNMYLLDEATHTTLKTMNPTITITLSSDLSNKNTVDIVLPYASFDLQVGPPLINNLTYYFPLQRAANSTQHTLGRAFLQEAYVIADYDRSTFSVSQALFPTDSKNPQLVTIHPPGDGHAGITPGAIAGIVIGVIAVAVIILAIFFIRRRRRAKRTPPSEPPAPAPITGEDMPKPLLAELGVAEVSELDNSGMRIELPSPDPEHRGKPFEMYGSPGLGPTGGGDGYIHEKPVEDVVLHPAELGAPVPIYELPAEDVEDVAVRRPLL